MTPEVERILQRHRQSAVVIDTNLLLLLIVGGIAPSLLSSHKRTSSFLPEDYELLLQVVRRFPRGVATTPNILAELDNHARQAGQQLRVRIQNRLREVIPEFRESYFRSAELVASEQFGQVDLTDCGILRFGRKGQLVLTADFELYRLLIQLNCNAINFNQLRQQEWN